MYLLSTVCLGNYFGRNKECIIIYYLTFQLVGLVVLLALLPGVQLSPAATGAKARFRRQGDNTTATLPPNMEMACHRRINGSIWCAPMEKEVELPPLNGSSGKLENLQRWDSEYGTGLGGWGESEQLKERPISGDVGLRSLDIPDSFSWYPGIAVSRFIIYIL